MAASPSRDLFVAMPFKKEYDPVFNVIRSAAELMNINVRRIDREPFEGSIINYVRTAIEESDYMVAVASEENGNVYYEIGLAHCQKKPVIILTSDPSALKFDLRDHRAIVYDPKQPDRAKNELVKHLAVLLNTPKDPQTQIGITLGGSARDPQAAYEMGLERAKQTIIREARLEEPVKVTRIEMRPTTGDVAIEIKDFLNVRVRAIVDVNGLIRVLKKVR
jgi:hypothetical protein